MQKLKQELNEKTVRVAAHSDPLKEKGITLIALIITIIVMLILVGVTINVALNGGLFNRAEEATKLTQIEADKEELLSAVVAAIGTDGKVVLGDIKTPTGWTETNGTYTSPKGNTFTVDKDGKITEGGNQSGEGNENQGETGSETAVKYNAAYVISDGRYYVFTDDGYFKLIMNGYGALTSVPYEIRENFTVQVSGESYTYDNALFVVKSAHPEWGLIFDGYFSDDGTVFYSIVNITYGENGEIDFSQPDFNEYNLDTTIDISEYL